MMSETSKVQDFMRFEGLQKMNYSMQQLDVLNQTPTT